MAEYIDRDLIKWYGCNFENPSCENRDCSDCSHAECSHAQVMQLPSIKVPDNPTNGDMIKAMFPNQTISCAIPITDSNGAKFYRTTINGVTDFTEEWWNAQYTEKRGSEE